jgi:drug/metabolite transporter (DMT)-like permease
LPPPTRRSPRLGYAFAATAATLWALNGSLSRSLLAAGMPAVRLAEMRVVCSVVLLATVLAVRRPALLRIERGDIGRLAFLGIFGFAAVTAFYYAAISRLDIGVALTIQYLGPMLLLIWLKLMHRRDLPRGLWAAAGLSVAGCFLVVRAYAPASLDGVGLAEAGGAAITFALYLYASERAGQRYSPATTLVWAFAFAAVFWAVTEPLWSFPFHDLASARHLALAAYVVIGGTLVPFGLMMAAVRHVPAPRAAVVATLEPVLASVIAWPLQHQVLALVQILGVIVVVGAIVWVQAQAPAAGAEFAPAYGASRRAAPPVG